MNTSGKPSIQISWAAGLPDIVVGARPANIGGSAVAVQLFVDEVRRDVLTQRPWSRRRDYLRSDEDQKFAFAERVLSESEKFADVFSIFQIRNAGSVLNLRSLSKSAQNESLAVVNPDGRLRLPAIDDGLFVIFGEASQDAELRVDRQ